MKNFLFFVYCLVLCVIRLYEMKDFFVKLFLYLDREKICYLSVVKNFLFCNGGYCY